MTVDRDPLALERHHDTVYVTVDGAWMIRRPRGADDGWLIDLAGGAGPDDWHLLNERARDRLSAVFVTPEQAVAALRAALADQVRPGQVWQHRVSGEQVEVTEVDHHAFGPDGTVYVRSLDSGQQWSPGDFRRTYRRVR